MRRLAAALPCALVLTVAGCGSDESSDVPPKLDPSAAASSSPSPSSSPSASASAAAFDDQGHEVVPGTIKTANAREKAVADAWLSYWQVRVDSYGNAKADPAAIGKVATGEAASNIVKYVAYLNQNKLHTVGDIKIGVSKVQLAGGNAAVVTCAENLSTDRRADGRPAEKLTRYYQFAGLVKSSGGTWLVQQAVKTSNDKCRA
jgi:hypothetical protein